MITPLVLTATAVFAAADTVRPGQVTTLVSPSDSTQHHAVYLPSTFTPDHPSPVVLLMDPRGRALLPLEGMRPAAERLGYVLISSYNTLSDHATDANDRALSAMLADAQSLFAVDPRRIYLAGMSGTARTAWTYARRLRGHVAGIIGFAAGLPGPVPPDAFRQFWGDSLVYFGGAGMLDYNYHELRALDVRLQRSPIRHRIDYHDGLHGWPPDRVLGDALEWMEWQAMRTGLRAVDSSWVVDYLDHQLNEVRELERTRGTMSAMERLGGVLRDGAEWLPRDSVAARLAAMTSSPDVRRTGRALARVREWEDTAWNRFERLVAALTAGRRLTADRAATMVGLAGLQQRAAQSENVFDRLAAQRVIERIAVHGSLYEPRIFLDRGDPESALVLLDLVRLIRPDDGDACASRTRAAAQRGDLDQALLHLACAVEGWGPAASLLVTHDDVAAVRARPEFREVISKHRFP